MHQMQLLTISSGCRAGLLEMENDVSLLCYDCRQSFNLFFRGFLPLALDKCFSVLNGPSNPEFLSKEGFMSGMLEVDKFRSYVEPSYLSVPCLTLFHSSIIEPQFSE